MEFIVYNQSKRGGESFSFKVCISLSVLLCNSISIGLYYFCLFLRKSRNIQKVSFPFSLSLSFFLFIYTHIMLPDQRTSFYDTLPMLNSWYESKPIKQEPPKQRTCLVSFSSEPPTVHTCKIKRPDIQRRTSSSDSGN